MFVAGDWVADLRWEQLQMAKLVILSKYSIYCPCYVGSTACFTLSRPDLLVLVSHNGLGLTDTVAVLAGTTAAGSAQYNEHWAGFEAIGFFGMRVFPQYIVLPLKCKQVHQLN